MKQTRRVCLVASSSSSLSYWRQVFAAGSEDMDTLTFASPILLKHLTFSEQKKMPVHEVHLQSALEGMGLTMDQFIDLCILLGCDYMEPVKGIGPKTAFKLIKEYGSIEAVKEHLEEKEEEKRKEAEKKGKDKARGVTFPELWPYKEAREIFKHPDVVKADDMEVRNAVEGKKSPQRLRWRASTDSSFPLAS